MPTMRLTRSKDSDEAIRPNRPRRGVAPKSYKDISDLTGAASKEDSDSMEVDDDEASVGTSTGDDDLMEDDTMDDNVKTRPRRGAAKAGRSSLEDLPDEKQANVRTSSRSNKFSSSMTEPSASLKDLLSRKEQLVDSDEDDNENRKPRPRNHRTTPTAAATAAATVSDKQLKKGSPQKSPARSHVQRRRSLPPCKKSDEASDDDSTDDVTDDDDDDEQEPLKVQRIIASRTETRKTWKTICQNMNTSEIHFGSRWFQTESKNKETKAATDDDGDVVEERFLVKWSDLSFLHTSWETQRDLIDQADAKTYLTTFSRKSVGGLLFTPDERCDGDYFDPAWKEIDRILSVQLPENWDKGISLSAETEDGWDSKSFGMILDNADPEFEQGTGRQFLIKWGQSPYAESTYEFERDLIVNEIEYKDRLKEFLTRRVKPSKATKRASLKRGEDEYKRLYNIFGDGSKLKDDARESAVEEYKQKLQDDVYKNGGQLRDYQAEGVAWMINNFVNKRSCILADEMGLGKTLQIAATANLLATALHRGGPVLVVAPLSTLTHWYREFSRWTNLNTIVYHGSAEDRRVLRENEFVYECDRPETDIPFNQLYLKKCFKKNTTKADSPWMIDVVITSPEIMIADDAKELTALQWEVLVVDEAHRLKNYNSKLAVGLRNDKFVFRHRILLTGTPIQNDVKEFWTLLNFIEPDEFDSMDTFMEKYGEMKSKERVDELHEEIRPYILRRLKEDVERSVPPKEETLIEVELTVAQKQYYRALYEKNVKFLNQNKKKPLDGPSLNNLAMQLRKVCNHLYLLNGIEEEFRQKQEPGLSEADFLVRGSGKLVLLDKLLPRLKEEGHRVLIFSQFKIMLDILEDYLNARQMKFERIDGSITGNRRQQAIDRFQTPTSAEKEAPFIMMLSTRAGGVGITLTAADTCIIFDSDWNPQNDLQAQARCHRIGQTKSVKVYRLLSRKTYEMQMFHMSSLKMGLDQAVLKGFESRPSGDGALSKDEVEKLLRHGAYDLFNEDKAGESEAISNDFVSQDIDSIMQRHSHTIVHENTGSKSVASGGTSTFSKASFKAKPTDPKSSKDNDVDVDDPDFWKKMIGEGSVENEEEIGVRRARMNKNYSEKNVDRELDASIRLDANAGDSSSDDSDAPVDEEEHVVVDILRWGGSKPDDWRKEDAEALVKALCTYGYGRLPVSSLLANFSKAYEPSEVKRMCWTAVLLTIVESAEDDSKSIVKREAKEAEKLLEKSSEGGVLAVDRSVEVKIGNSKLKLRASFEKLWRENLSWLEVVVTDAVAFSANCAPRQLAQSDSVPRNSTGSEAQLKQLEAASNFATTVWPLLKSKGWQTTVSDSGSTQYSFQGAAYFTIASVIKAAKSFYPEMISVPDSDLSEVPEAAAMADQQPNIEVLSISSCDPGVVVRFLQNYGSRQLVFDRSKTSKRIRLPRRILTTASLLHNASSLVERVCPTTVGYNESIHKLASVLVFDKRHVLPHPLWTSRHDSVLIHAILKHGWIEQDIAARAIAGDSSVVWGSPFDKGNVEEPRMSDDTACILSTADRVATLLNNHSEVLDDLKDFNQQLLVRAYSLIRQVVDEDVDFFLLKARAWIVDRSGLQAGTPSVGGADEAVDLPPKKDLVKRAKAILQRAIAPPNVTKKQSPSEYAELDQKDGANVFLAELLRALLKEPTHSKHYKKLCKWASQEAQQRAASFTSGASKERAAAKADLKRISTDVDDFMRNEFKAATQYKNVLRAILGEETHKPRKEGESIFPVKKVFSALQTSTTTGKGAFDSVPALRASIPATKRSGKFSGDKAIASARRRFDDNSSTAEDLAMTAIETVILSATCRVGIPVWKDDWRSVVSGPSIFGTGVTWASFGSFIVELAANSHQQIVSKLAKERSKGNSLEVVNLQQRKDIDETTMSQAKEYAAEPENLAKKSVMMLAKIFGYMPDGSAAKNAARPDMSLGPNVLYWLKGEVSRWAESLDVVDEGGFPFALSAVDFVEDFSVNDQSITISSVFDKPSCLQVASQVAMLTRGRSFISFYDQSRLRSEISRASAQLRSSEEKWIGQPYGWAECNDFVLFNRVMEKGLTEDAVQSRLTFGENDQSCLLAFSNDRFQVTREDIQFRVNQLVRTLHDSEGNMKSRILEERRNERKAESNGTKWRNDTGRSLTAEFEEIDASDDEVQILSPTTARASQRERLGKRKSDGNGELRDRSFDQKRPSL